MTIRDAVKDDLSSLLEIYNDVILNSTAIYQYEPWTLAAFQEWFDRKQSNNQPILVAEIEGKVAGYATFGPFRNPPAYLHSTEHTVHIHPHFRRKGVGKELMIRLIALAKAQNMHSMIGGVDAENAGSVRFHLDLGFKEVAHFEQVGYKFDRWLDLKFFQLMLTDVS